MSGFVTGAYIVSGILFILSLKSLSHQESAKKGNIYGIIGMIIAVLATISVIDFSNFEQSRNYLISAVFAGSIIGLFLAIRVKMTEMPELIALLHSFVGLAAVLIAFVNYLDSFASPLVGVAHTIHSVEVVLGLFIGAVTFTGSLVAFAKLKEIVSSKPLVLPLKHILNLIMLLGAIYLMVQFVGSSSPMEGVVLLAIITLIAFAFGLHLVASIGGADMPVVISMLNSYSGWAAAATGFMLSNDLLIIAGALVGSSGAILSYIMCKAMNRSFISVIMGGFGVKKVTSGNVEQGEYAEINAEEASNMLLNSKKILVTPGYGMAISHAQYAIKELFEHLKKSNIELTFAIHPVAGRMPGHMNVLLAEAKIPYDIVYEMDEVNDELSEIDTILVIGANDTVNPSAIDDADSPIAGMPVIKAWEAKNVIVFKRGRGVGYAGVENPLFFKENTKMLFGDAKQSLEDIMQFIR